MLNCGLYLCGCVLGCNKKRIKHYKHKNLNRANEMAGIVKTSNGGFYYAIKRPKFINDECI